MATEKAESSQKPDAPLPPRISDIEWLVECRSENQAAMLRLVKQFRRYQKCDKTSDLSAKASMLLAICFSHWRAVFLADRLSKHEETFKAANQFLEILIRDNAIGYQQDRLNKDWTFNYYMDAAGAAIDKLAKDWPEVESARDKLPKKWNKNLHSRRSHWRWERQMLSLLAAQNQFDQALDSAAPLKPSTSSGKK